MMNQPWQVVGSSVYKLQPTERPDVFKNEFYVQVQGTDDPRTQAVAERIGHLLNIGESTKVAANLTLAQLDEDVQAALKKWFRLDLRRGYGGRAFTPDSTVIKAACYIARSS